MIGKSFISWETRIYNGSTVIINLGPTGKKLKCNSAVGNDLGFKRLAGVLAHPDTKKTFALAAKEENQTSPPPKQYDLFI